MNGMLYMVSKVFANTAANILGVAVWTDSYARQLPHWYSEMPVWKMSLPDWFSLGGIKEIGIYQFDPMSPVRTAVIFFSLFGVLPALLVHTCMHAGWKQIKNLPFTILVSFVSGIAFYCLGPVSGRSVDRLVGYGWPVFWVVLPLLCFSDRSVQCGTKRMLSSSDSTLLWLIQICCQWGPILVLRAGLPFGDAVSIAIIAFCYHYAWKLIKRDCAPRHFADGGVEWA
jgi:hypothetical protein